MRILTLEPANSAEARTTATVDRTASGELEQHFGIADAAAVLTVAEQHDHLPAPGGTGVASVTASASKIALPPPPDSRSSRILVRRGRGEIDQEAIRMLNDQLQAVLRREAGGELPHAPAQPSRIAPVTLALTSSSHRHVNRQLLVADVGHCCDPLSTTRSPPHGAR